MAIRRIIFLLLLVIFAYIVYVVVSYVSNETYHQPSTTSTNIQIFKEDGSTTAIQGYSKKTIVSHTVRDCFLVLLKKGTVISLYSKLSPQPSNSLQQFQHDFPQLRLICFHNETQKAGNLSNLKDSGIKSVQYQYVKDKLLATGILLNGEKVPLYIAPESFIKQLGQKKENNPDTLPSIENQK